MLHGGSRPFAIKTLDGRYLATLPEHVVAESLGRPVALLRIGGRLPADYPSELETGTKGKVEEYAPLA